MKRFAQIERPESKRKKSLQKRIRKWIAWSHKLSQVISAEQSNLKVKSHKNLGGCDNSCKVVVVIPPSSTENKEELKCENVKSNLLTPHYVDEVTIEPKFTDFMGGVSCHNHTSSYNSGSFVKNPQGSSESDSFKNGGGLINLSQNSMHFKQKYPGDGHLTSGNNLLNPQTNFDKPLLTSLGASLLSSSSYTDSTKKQSNDPSNKSELIIDNGSGIFYYCLNDSELNSNMMPKDS